MENVKTKLDQLVNGKAKRNFDNKLTRFYKELEQEFGYEIRQEILHRLDMNGSAKRWEGRKNLELMIYEREKDCAMVDFYSGVEALFYKLNN
jgi:hypothetical protein